MSNQNNGLSHPDDKESSNVKDTSASTPILTPTTKGRSLSLDAWALIVAILLALAVKFDVFKNVPW